MMDQLWIWVGFNVFVLAMLAVDLFVFHKDAHEVSLKEAAGWSIVWIALALAFGAGIYMRKYRDDDDERPLSDGRRYDDRDDRQYRKRKSFWNELFD